MPGHGKWLRTAYDRKRIKDSFSLSRMIPSAKVYNNFEDIKNSNESISYLENSNIIKINNCVLYDKKFLLHKNKKYKLNRIFKKNNYEKHKLSNKEINKYKKMNKLLIINFYPNFAHILLDTLPCLVNFYNDKYEIDIKIYIFNDDYGINCMIKQILYGFIDNCNIINSYENLNINEAYIISPLNKASKQYIRYNTNYLKLLQKTNNILKNNITKININIPIFNRVYVSRRYRKESENKGVQNIANNTKVSCSRLINNHKEFVDHINKKWDFEEIFLEDYNLLEKIYILKNANYILVDGGASCAIFNFLEKKNILVLLCKFYSFWCFPEEIARKKNGNKINYMTGVYKHDKLFKNVDYENRSYDYNIESVDYYFKNKWII